MKFLQLAASEMSSFPDKSRMFLNKEQAYIYKSNAKSI